MGPLNKYSTAGLLILNIVLMVWFGAGNTASINSKIFALDMKVGALNANVLERCK
jgi:hypothetical protein